METQNGIFIVLFHVWLFSCTGCCLSLSVTRSSQHASPLTSTVSDATATTPPVPPRLRPIVYTIAGSDSGGGAGIQADLHAIRSLGGHGCSALTCLTAQNSMGVVSVHTPPVEFLMSQLETLVSDLPPSAIKIGMLGNTDHIRAVAHFLTRINSTPPNNVEKNQHMNNDRIKIVLDPVMISTSGHRLMDPSAQATLVRELFPLVDVLTPNKYEAEALLTRSIDSAEDFEQAARDLICILGANAVVMKGGHFSTSSDNNNDDAFAHDYFLSKPTTTSVSSFSSSSEEREHRLCDSNLNHHRGVWLRSQRYATNHTHGTGCTLSSSLAAAMALGVAERHGLSQSQKKIGVRSNIDWIDALCIAKAYVTAGIANAAQLGQGPGPVAHTCFPSTSEHFPAIVIDDPSAQIHPFPRLRPFHSQTENNLKEKTSLSVLGPILPIVDSIDWVERLCCIPGITDLQLRIKGNNHERESIFKIVQTCQSMCSKARVRLWINDHWEAAVAAQCFGVHFGQEDLFKCVEAGSLSMLREQGIALGISTHSFGELAVALGISPSYISLGPVFATQSKTVRFDPQDLETVRKWKQLIPSDIPLVAIGGIVDARTAALVRSAGADCIAVIGAIARENDPSRAVERLKQAMTMTNPSRFTN